MPPIQKTVALPLCEGELTPWVIENEMPSQGEGEPSTKFGGPWPYWPRPPVVCKFERTLPLGGGEGDEGGLVGGGFPGAGGVGGVPLAALRCWTLIARGVALVEIYALRQLAGHDGIAIGS